MKKFCGVLFLTVALLLAGSYDNRAEAYYKYLGTTTDDYAIYLNTDLVRLSGNNVYQGFTCVVKFLKRRDGKLIDGYIIDYRFWGEGTANGGRVWYFSYEHENLRHYVSESAIAQAILDGVLSIYN